MMHVCLKRKKVVRIPNWLPVSIVYSSCDSAHEKCLKMCNFFFIFFSLYLLDVCTNDFPSRWKISKTILRWCIFMSVYHVFEISARWRWTKSVTDMSRRIESECSSNEKKKNRTESEERAHERENLNKRIRFVLPCSYTFFSTLVHGI